MVIYISENVELYQNFTARQNLSFFAKLGGRKKVSNQELDATLGRVGLPEEVFTRRVKTLSKGMRQRLGIAIAIMKNARAIILDEPTSGLDPKGGADFLNLLRELKAEGKAIFMSTHDIFRAKEIADRIGILVQGNPERELTRQEILKEDLEALYLQSLAQYDEKVSSTTDKIKKLYQQSIDGDEPEEHETEP